MVFLAKFFNANDSNLSKYTSPSLKNATISSPARSSTRLKSKNSKGVFRTVSITNSEEAIEFFNETTVDRLKSMEAGKLAAKRGSTQEIRDYGKLMLKDQANMIKELTTIARARRIDIATKLDHRQAEELKELDALMTGEFDKKFIKMIRNDHRRDVRKFKSMIDAEDADIARLSNKYHPLVKSHLDKVKTIKLRPSNNLAPIPLSFD